MSTANDFEIGISSLEPIPSIIPDDFVKALEECGLSVASKRRPQEIFAGIAWLLPTAIVVFVTQKYIGTLLQEAAKDHYPKIKDALVKLARRTTGDAREIHVVHVASSPHKIQDSDGVVLSVVAQINTGHTVKFVFEQGIGETDVENAVATLFQMLVEHRRYAPNDSLTAIVVTDESRMHTPVIMRFDLSKGEWMPWRNPPRRD